MALAVDQVWRYGVTYSVMYMPNGLVEWTDTVWISETEDPRADHDTDYLKKYTAYNVPAVVVLTDASGTTSEGDSATFTVDGGMNDGDTVQVVGTYDADGSSGIPFDILITISNTQSTQEASIQIVGGISGSDVLQANGASNDVNNPNYSYDINVWANSNAPDLGEAVTITSVTYVANAPTIPNNPT